MSWTIFPNSTETFFALISGAIFGFLIRKATLSRFNTMVSQLLLKDFTVLKVLLSAVLTAGIGLYLQGKIAIKPTLNISSMPILLTAFGGSLFGIGLAITGYTPGTMVAAIAEGSKDAITGFFGMIVGTFIFNGMYPFFSQLMMAQDIGYKKTMYQYFETSELILLVVLCLALFAIAKSSRRKTR